MAEKDETEQAQGQAQGALSRAAVIEELTKVMDPELMLNIVDLGLVYKVEVAEGKVAIEFTLTYPGCPAGESIRRDVQTTIEDFTGLSDVSVRIVWDPPWQPDFMTEEVRVSLGYPI